MGQSTKEDTLGEAAGVWQQGQLLEVTIADLNHNGEGVGRWQGRVVFVPDTVPGERMLVRLIRVKPEYAQGKLHELLEPSPHRVRPSCIVADKCGGCQWQHVAYEQQLEAKRNLVFQDLERIGGFSQPVVEPVLAVADPLGYRNKATYPIKAVRSAKAAHNPEAVNTPALQQKSRLPRPMLKTPMKADSPQHSLTIQAGYYQKGSHQLINLNQCPIQDQRLNPFLAEIKLDIQRQNWSVYDETTHRGEVRHLGLRIGRHTGEVLLTLISRSDNLPGLEQQARTWMQCYPELVGVCLNINPHHTNTIFGTETRCLAGRSYLRETFAGLEFQIQPTTFFQVNTEQAEALINIIQSTLELTGNETLLDAYCGIGTMTLPLAKRVQRAIGIEMQPEAVEQARFNATLNDINNVIFHAGKTEEILPKSELDPPDIVLLDPPRKGCEPTVIETLLQLRPQQIVYVSCNSATLARDLKKLCQVYTLIKTQPVDFFPQTAHVECAAFLTI
jgi:23S rRNA (uracil1939-C5)-methyltransferase